MRGTGSAFTRRLFTLPVSSFTLATVPFALGVAVLGSLWVAVSLGLLRPCGARVPVVMPALAVTASVGWMQAWSWAPFPLRWVRMGLLVVGLWGPLPGAIALLDLGVSPALVSSLLAALLMLSYFIALVGVRLARRGVGVDVDVAAETAVDRVPGVPVTAQPFSSALRAQLWLEWRHLGWVSFWQTLVLVLLAVPQVHLLEVALSKPFMLAAIGPWAERMGSAWVALSALLVFPAAFSMIGGDVNRHAARGKEGISPFFATRAISNTQIVQAKLLMTAVFAVVLWAELLAVALGWVAATGHLPDMMGRLGDLAGFPGAGPAVLAGGVVVCCAANWLCLVGNLWVGLSGRSWVSAWAMLTFVAVLVGIALAVKGWRPAWYPWLVALVVAGLACKVVASAGVCRRLLARGYVTPGLLAALLAGWLVVTGSLAGLAVWLFPGGWVTSAGVVLLTPLATSLLAPVALAWDRHR